MKIVIAGGTGFLGRPLAAALAARRPRRRRPHPRQRRRAPAARSRALVAWTPDGDAGALGGEIDGAGAVVNLAGESIAGKRWTDAQKQRILDSRVQATRSLVAADRSAAATPPPVFVSGSAVGYYGPLRRRDRDRGHAAGLRLPRARLRAVGSRSDARRQRPHARRLRPHRPRARARRRRAAADAAAVQVRRRRTGRIGPPVLAVDSPRGLGRARALGDRDAGGRRRRSTRPRRTR